MAESNPQVVVMKDAPQKAQTATMAGNGMAVAFAVVATFAIQTIWNVDITAEVGASIGGILVYMLDWIGKRIDDAS